MKSSDLERLGKVLAAAREVVAVREVVGRDDLGGVVALRHDVDSRPDVAARMATWEAERGYRSTYYVLHTAPYFKGPHLRGHLEHIAGLGHEIGIHTNALAEALTTDDDPDWVLDRALRKLREWGHEITGVAGHGDERCYTRSYGSPVLFVNHEHFEECPAGMERPRTIRKGRHSMILTPRPLARFGLTHEALISARRHNYLSDSGGVWSVPPEDMIPTLEAGYHVQILQHPDWWHGVYGG